MNKKAFSLIELLVSITLLALLVITSLQSFRHQLSFNQKRLDLELQKVDLLATQAILHNVKAELSYKNQKLYLNGALLLDGVTRFSQDKKSIKLCTEGICQDWSLP